MEEKFMQLVPAHRTFINYLINKNIIDNYLVSMESQTVWITFNLQDKDAVDAYLVKSPLYKYWDYSIEELFLYDGQMYRMPTFQLN